MDAFAAIRVEKREDYTTHLPTLEAYLTGSWLTDLATFSSFVFHSLPRLNWVGFYLFDGTKLRLGPFVGKPACTEIQPGRGVCGTAYAKRAALRVANVDEFPGHITCDTASRSELVLSLPFADGACGVLDLDSPELDRFTAEDEAGLALWLAALGRSVPAEIWAKRPWE